MNHKRIQPLIAQVSADLELASSRAEFLRSAGYNVVTFGSAEEFIPACKSLRFDLLMVGHSLEYRGSEAVCALFREYKPDSPILQLQLLDGISSTADYVFNISKGPDSLLALLNEILNIWALQTRAGD